MESETNITDYARAKPRTSALDAGTRVMVFEEDGVFVAMGVDVSTCTHGEDLEELAHNWELITTMCQKLMSEREVSDWEPPLATEFEPVWKNGSPVEFLDGVEARMVDYDAFSEANDAYSRRYEKLRTAGLV